MTSTTGLPPALPPAAFASLVADASAVACSVASGLSGGPGSLDVGGLPAGAAEEHARVLLAAADRLTAAASRLLGVVDADPGRLVGGAYASTARFLEAEAGMSKAGAAAVAARARDLREEAPELEEAWLAGRVSADAVREITLGLRRVLVRVPFDQRAEVRARVLAVLVPLAEHGSVAQVCAAVRRLRFLLDPDGTTREALDASVGQSLRCEQVDAITRIEVWLTHENAAAVMTVLEQTLAARRRAGDLAPDQVLPDGVDPESAEGRRLLRARRSRGLADALADVMRGLLDTGRTGSHHAVAPHVTLTLDLDHLTGPNSAALPDLIASQLPVGAIAMPGHDDPALVPAGTARRILCDASITTVITRHPDQRTSLDPVVAALTEHTREVLWLSRAVRTVSFRQRRALEARDRHCAFPGCRAHPRRCRAHHVLPWEQGGGSDPDNLVLLCDTHHHAVHEGRWTITSVRDPLTTGAFAFHPPDPPPP